RSASMLEIIALLISFGVIGNMACRRGRSESLFGLLLTVCWFGGEVAGGVVGYACSVAAYGDQPNLLLIYGLALSGAALGAGLAFLIAHRLPPIDGVWREVPVTPVRRSRLWGTVAGGLFGGVIGAVVVLLMYGGVQVDASLPLVMQGFLGVGFLGALLGLISG